MRLPVLAEHCCSKLSGHMWSWRVQFRAVALYVVPLHMLRAGSLFKMRTPRSSKPLHTTHAAARGVACAHAHVPEKTETTRGARAWSKHKPEVS